MQSSPEVVNSAQNLSSSPSTLERCAELLLKHSSGSLVVTSIGAGYVGALTAITMACKNPNTLFKVCDINEELIDSWNACELPFYEPLLDEYF